MGASQFVEVQVGTDLKSAFNAAVDQAGYEHGHGYSGSLAEKDSVVVCKLPKLPDDMPIHEFANICTCGIWEDDDEPVTYSVRVKNPDPNAKPWDEYLWESRPVPAELIPAIKAITAEGQRRLEGKTGQRVFVFFGLASS